MFLFVTSADLGYFIFTNSIEIHKHLFQGFYKIRCHRAPLLQIQLQMRKIFMQK